MMLTSSSGPESAIDLAESPRLGVFICDCGDAIAKQIDTEALHRKAAGLPGVVFAAHEAYPCSKGGLARIQRSIGRHQLERILIAGCAPRLVEGLFQKTAHQANLDPGHVHVVNIREQCAWAHPESPSAALEKAIATVAAGAARLTTGTAARTRSGRVVRTALVLGSGLGGLTAALSLATADIHVILVERSADMGASQAGVPSRTREQTAEKARDILAHEGVDLLLNTRLLGVRGRPGEYEVRLQQGDQTRTLACGAIIVSNDGRPRDLGHTQWFDRTRVRTQTEFEAELDAASEPGASLAVWNLVMVLCADEGQPTRCSRVCCNLGIRQAILAKERNPAANVTVLFRELFLGGLGEAYEAELARARKLGVTFFRYRHDLPPAIEERTVDVPDPLTEEAVRIPYDRVVLTTSLVPQSGARALASLLGLPQDEAGFLAEPRLRLRPGQHPDPGIYVLGSAQQPADSAEALFQAYLTSARVRRFLSQDQIAVRHPVPTIDSDLCTGCANCAQVCPTRAIHLEKRDGILSLAALDDLACLGCGSCVVVCPVRAITLPGWDDLQILAQIRAALGAKGNGRPRVLALACEWSAYGAADMAGVERHTYSPGVNLIRMNCSARFDPQHILWAFLNGADGVLLGACPPGECHYGLGNLRAGERVKSLQSELAAHGLNPRRLRLEFMRVDDGERFAQVAEDFAAELRKETAH